MEHNSSCVFFLESESVEKMPADGLSLPVFIGCEPHCSSRLCRLFELGHDFLLVVRHYIFRFEAMLYIDAQRIVMQVSDVSHAGFHHEIFPEEFLDGLGLCRRLHYYKITLHIYQSS